MTSRKSKLLAGSLFTTLLLTAGAASAQAPANPPPPRPAAATADVEELIVTGSRIRKNEYTSDAPITVVTSEQATLQGLVDTAQILQSQPVASGSGQVNDMLGGFVFEGGPGAQTISLRGLGANRTLVMLDGRRLGPAGVRGQVGPVDLNVVPSSIVDRIEILKDGASSIYGSDAVAGVVNFITKKRLDDGTFSVYASQPQDSGGAEYDVYGSWGKTFDRGYFSLSADAQITKELRVGQRHFLSCAEDRFYDPATLATKDLTDPRTGATKCWNVFSGEVQLLELYGGYFQYSDPGVTYPTAAQGNNIAAIFPQLATAGWVRAGRNGLPATFPYLNYDSPLYARASAITPSERYTFFANGGYNVTPGIEAYGELLLNRRDSKQHGLQQLFPVVAFDNPNNPFVDAGGNQIDAIPIVAFQSDQSQRVDYIRAVGGLRGKFGDAPLVSGWDWDIYAQFSKSDAKYTTDYIPADRLDAVTSYGVACNQSVITVNPAQCPAGGINFFSRNFLAGNFTQAEKDFLFERSNGTTTYEQIAVEGTVTGDLFQLPAGALSGAFGFNVRRDKIDDEPDVQESAGNQYNLSSAQPTKGQDTVKEVFAELNAPVVRELGPFGAIDVSASGRYTDYKSYGSNSTYKLGFNWQVLPLVRVRATHGTSFRAPALYELFLGDQSSFLSQNQVDPCINYQNSSNDRLRASCAAQGVPQGYAGGGAGVTIFTGGGAGILKAETSKATTVGVIFTPHFSTFDLSFAVDYSDIEVRDEVRQFGVRNIISQCLTSAQFPTDPFCSLFSRDPTSHGITIVHDNYVNVASQHNRAIDLNLRWKQEFGIGTFTTDIQTTWQLEDTVQLLGASEPEDFNGAVNDSDFTGQVQTRFDRGDWTGYLTVDLIGKASNTELTSLQKTDIHNSNLYGQYYAKQFAEFMAYYSLSLRKKMDTWTVQGGVRNLFDDAPPALSGNQGFRLGISALNNYDFRGRLFWFRVDKRF